MACSGMCNPTPRSRQGHGEAVHRDPEGAARRSGRDQDRHGRSHRDVQRRAGQRATHPVIVRGAGQTADRHVRSPARLGTRTARRSRARRSRIQDSANHAYKTNTNGAGGYVFTSTDGADRAGHPLHRCPQGRLRRGLREGPGPAGKERHGAGHAEGRGLALDLAVALDQRQPRRRTMRRRPRRPDRGRRPSPPTRHELASARRRQLRLATCSSSSAACWWPAGIGAIVLVADATPNEARQRTGRLRPSPAAGPAAAWCRRPRPVQTSDLGSPRRWVAGERGNDDRATLGALPSRTRRPCSTTAPPVDEFPDPYGAPIPQGGGQSPAVGTAGAAGVRRPVPPGPTVPRRPAVRRAGPYGGPQCRAQAATPTAPRYAAAAPAAGGRYGAAAPAGGGRYGGRTAVRRAHRHVPPGAEPRGTPEAGYGEVTPARSRAAPRAAAPRTASADQYGGGGYDQAGYDQGGDTTTRPPSAAAPSTAVA